MRRSNWTAAFYLTLVFLCGILIGAIGDRLYNNQVVMARAALRPTSEEYRKKFVQDMHSRLGLDDEQLTTLNAIMDETRDRYKALKERYKPEMKAIQEQQTEKIRGMLRPGQVQLFEEYRRERELEKQRDAAKGPSGC